MPYGGGSIATSSGSQDISGTVATFPWSPQAGNSNLMLQNINDGAFFALEMSTSLGWNEDFPPEDYPQNIPVSCSRAFLKHPSNIIYRNCLVPASRCHFHKFRHCLLHLVLHRQ